MLGVIILTSVVLTLLVTEKLHLDRQVKKIPLRILVNGTRGKSTVVKYISSMLRENQKETFSKITGITPTLFFKDDSYEEIKRRGGARVTEQFGIIKKAAKENKDALVLECMSISPELQRIESKVLKPHYYVITNIREDHLEEFGESKDDWIDSICSAIPNNCTVITSDGDNLEKIKEYATRKYCRVIFAKEERNSISDRSIHPGNVGITSELAKLEGLDYSLNVEKLKSLHHDELVYKSNMNGKEINFINCFSTNDVQSTSVNYSNSKIEEYADYALFNSRADRPLRSKKFMEWLSKHDFEKYILTGTNSGYARRILLSKGIDKDMIISFSRNADKKLLDYLDKNINRNINLLGCGNIKGDAFAIINALKGNG